MHTFIQKINKTIVRAEEAIMVVLLGAIVIVMTLQVTMRYVFQNPVTWSQELAILMLIYLSFLSADVVMYRKAHIGITYFAELLPKKLNGAVNILLYVIILAALGLIIPKTFLLIRMQSGHIVAGVLPLSKSVWIYPLAVVFPLMCLKGLEFILENVNKMIKDSGKAV